MQFQKVLSKALRHAGRRVNAAADLDGVVSANVGGKGTQRTSVRSRKRVVQRGGRSIVSEEHRQQSNSKEV